MSTKVTVIVNQAAGPGYKPDVADRLTHILRAKDLDARITLMPSGAGVLEAAKRAAHEKPQIIVAAGGDGTVNAVASALVGTDIPLAVLPLGTLNHFAKDLCIPLHLEAAARTIQAGHVIRVDVADVNERIFVNNSSLGLYPALVRYRKEQQERLGQGKLPAFAWAALMVLRRYPFLSVRVDAEQGQLERRTPFVFIGNNQYQMEGFKLGARQCLDAGQLSLYLANRTGRWGLARLGLRALFGRLHQAEDFDAFCAKKFGLRHGANR